jgi:preprotein translocase subunit SecB
MAETENGAVSNSPEAAGQPRLQIMAQFIRDLSFENIVAQKGVQGEVSPDTQVQVAIDAKKRSVENQYEIISKYMITSKNKSDGKTLFALEMEYGGIFLIENVPDEQLHPYLLIECPRMMFPFVRRIVSDITRDGGFPQLNLEIIDFVQLYRQTLLQRQAKVAEGAPKAS